MRRRRWSNDERRLLDAGWAWRQTKNGSHIVWYCPCGGHTITTQGKARKSTRSNQNAQISRSLTACQN